MVAMTRELQTVADDLGCSMAKLALAWVLKNERTTTILMGGKLKYLKENLGALKVVEKLTPEVMERIEGIVKNKPLPEIVWRTHL